LIELTPFEETDRELVDRIASGDEEAFRGLFRRYAPIAMAVARRVLGQPYLAEESVQDAFLSVWRDPGGFDHSRGSVRSWLMTTVHNRSVDLVRREESQRRRVDSVRADALVDADDFAQRVVDELGIPEERRVVRAALEGLPTEQHEVIELMYFSGLSQSAIALRLGLPLGTVKSRTLLGMRKMRCALADIER
jgi:RNA polymerase sigma-70 factor (ECF subfamily)